MGGYTADLATYDAKYEDLSAPAEKMFFRLAELTARPAAIDALSTKLSKIEDLMAKWETSASMDHITEEERKEILDKVGEVRAWIDEKVAEQEAKESTEDPVFTSAEVPGQTKRIESIVARLMKKTRHLSPKRPRRSQRRAKERPSLIPLRRARRRK